MSPDDVCEVCGQTRENHGDMHHKFSEDGQLIPIEPPKEVPKNLPPQQRGGADPQQRAFLRLIEVLVAKDLLTGEDLLHVFGGVGIAPDHGQAAQGSVRYRDPAST